MKDTYVTTTIINVDVPEDHEELASKYIDLYYENFSLKGEIKSIKLENRNLNIYCWWMLAVSLITSFVLRFLL